MFFHVCTQPKAVKAEETHDLGNLHQLGGFEHKPGTNGNVNSTIKQHAESGHDIHRSYANILETGVSKNKRLFLESLHSFLDKNSVNERASFPRVYASQITSLGGQRTITSQRIKILWIARNHHSLKKTAVSGWKFRGNFSLFRSGLKHFSKDVSDNGLFLNTNPRYQQYPGKNKWSMAAILQVYCCL